MNGCYTINREIFIGKIFLWGKSTTKIKHTKIFIQWKIATTNIYEAYYTWLAHLHACSCSLVRSYFKPANGLPDMKGSLTGSLPSRAIALSHGISSASAASHTSLYTDGNHESMNTSVAFEFLHGSSCSSVSKLTLETASPKLILKKNSVRVIFSLLKYFRGPWLTTKIF